PLSPRRARPPRDLHAFPTRRSSDLPVSVRADVERGALGNQVAAVWAPLPVGLTDPVKRLQTISAAMDEIKESGQAVAAQVLTGRSEEQRLNSSHRTISYAVFCLKKK